jgi:hypothetical protein
MDALHASIVESPRNFARSLFWMADSKVSCHAMPTVRPRFPAPCPIPVFHMGLPGYSSDVGIQNYE